MTFYFLTMEGERPKLAKPAPPRTQLAPLPDDWEEGDDLPDPILMDDRPDQERVLDGYPGYVVAFTLDRDPDKLEYIDVEAQALAYDLEKVRAFKWNEVKAYRDARRYGGCDTPSGRIDTDLESQHKLNGAVTMALVAGALFQVHWTMEDNSVFPMDAAAMVASGMAVGVYDATCHAVGQWLRGQIDNPDATAEEILAIDPAGAPWPS